MALRMNASMATLAKHANHRAYIAYRRWAENAKAERELRERDWSHSALDELNYRGRQLFDHSIELADIAQAVCRHAGVEYVEPADRWRAVERARRAWGEKASA